MFGGKLRLEEYDPSCCIGFPCKVIAGKLGENVSEETADLKWFKPNIIPWGNVLSGNKEVIARLLLPVE